VLISPEEDDLRYIDNLCHLHNVDKQEDETTTMEEEHHVILLQDKEENNQFSLIHQIATPSLEKLSGSPRELGKKKEKKKKIMKFIVFDLFSLQSPSYILHFLSIFNNLKCYEYL
jgi:hypothetical protein